MRRPLTTPHPRPDTRQAAIPSVRATPKSGYSRWRIWLGVPASCTMISAPTTEAKTRIELIDRSMTPAIGEKVIPDARISVWRR